MVNFSIEQQNAAGGVVVLKCGGAVDYSNFNYGDDLVKKLISEGHVRLVFDLSGVTYVSSSGWTVFLGNLKAAREKGGDIMLAAMRDEVKHAFMLLELENLIDYFDTADEAVKRAGSQ